MAKSTVIQKKGHNWFVGWFIIGPLTLWIVPIYWSVSKKHCWGKKNTAKSIVCPYCGSKDIQVISQGKKVSMTKALAGSLLFQGGAILGLNSKGGEVQFFCSNCNKPFKAKLN